MEDIINLDFDFNSIKKLQDYIKSIYIKYKYDDKVSYLITYIENNFNISKEDTINLLKKNFGESMEIKREEELISIIQNEFFKNTEISKIYFNYSLKLSKKESTWTNPNKIMNKFSSINYIEEIVINKIFYYIIIYNKDTILFIDKSLKNKIYTLNTESILNNNIKNISLNNENKLKLDIRENIKAQKKLNKRKIIVNNKNLVKKNLNNKIYIDNNKFSKENLVKIKEKLKSKKLPYYKSEDRKIIKNNFNQIFGNQNFNKEKLKKKVKFSNSFQERYKVIHKQLNSISKTISEDKIPKNSNKNLKLNKKKSRFIDKISDYNIIFKNKKYNEIFYFYYDFRNLNLYIILKNGVIILFKVNTLIITLKFIEILKIKNIPYILTRSKKIFNYELLIIGFKTGQLMIYNIIDSHNENIIENTLNNLLFKIDIINISKIEIVNGFIFILNDSRYINILKINHSSIENYMKIKSEKYIILYFFITHI